MVYTSDECITMMGDRGIHLKPTNSLFQPNYTKERNSKYTLQKKNVKISAHRRNRTCRQGCNIALTQKLPVTTTWGHSM
jgi:hypothetical protein